jgi:hypothetical protein
VRNQDSQTCSGTVKWCSQHGKVWQFLWKPNRITIRPRNPTPWVYKSENMSTQKLTCACSNYHYFELRTSCLLGRRSTAWANLTALKTIIILTAKKWKQGQEWWFTPIIPASQEHQTLSEKQTKRGVAQVAECWLEALSSISSIAKECLSPDEWMTTLWYIHTIYP